MQSLDAILNANADLIIYCFTVILLFGIIKAIVTTTSSLKKWWNENNW